MNFSRKELIETDATMNQMRNAVYVLARLMEKNGIRNSKERLRKMGKSIAKTYKNYWKPTDNVTLVNLKDVITTIYQKILNSAVSIEINEVEKIIKVQDYRCALCKYNYDNIEVAGCELLLGLVSEYVTLINNDFLEPTSIFLEPYEVVESRSYGNKKCIQVFKYRIGGEG